MYSSRLKEFEKNINSSNEKIEELQECQTVTSNDTFKPQIDISVKELAGYGIGLSSILTETLISHPFLVLRHQCQVRSRSKRLHLQPLSLLPIIQTYISRQGILTLWKGLSGLLTVKAVIIVVENVITEVLPLPKEVTVYSNPTKIVLHLLLKIISWAICTPFYASSMVEFVQSDVASEPTTLVSCLMEGLRRLMPNPYTSGSRLASLSTFKSEIRSVPIRTSRLLPVWRLLLPVVVLGVGQHVIRSVVFFTATAYLKQGEEQEQLIVEAMGSRSRLTNPRLRTVSDGDAVDQCLLTNHRQETVLQTTYTQYYNDLAANLWASLAADALLYPLETIVVRLCVQGTRTLVDNLDTADSVLPIVSSFDGPFDALRSAATASPFGLVGLYRGFGALVLQFAVQFAFLTGVKHAYQHLLCYYSMQQPPAPGSRSSVVPTASQQPATPIPAYQSVPSSIGFPAHPNAYSIPSSVPLSGAPVPRRQQPPSVWEPLLDSDRWGPSDSSSKTQFYPKEQPLSFEGFNSGLFD